jgi:hypothetical protein
MALGNKAAGRPKTAILQNTDFAVFSWNEPPAYPLGMENHGQDSAQVFP